MELEYCTAAFVVQKHGKGYSTMCLIMEGEVIFGWKIKKKKKKVHLYAVDMKFKCCFFSYFQFQVNDCTTPWKTMCVKGSYFVFVHFVMGTIKELYFWH